MICVLLSTYNGEKFIGEQLESLKNQQGVDIKILIRDDGSKDNTKGIIKAYQTKNPSLIDFFEEQNIGFANSFSRLIEIALNNYPNAEYFAFCDQDDVWLPNKLKEAIKKIQNESSEIPITYCSNTQLVDSNLKYIGLALKIGEVKLTKERALIQNFATGCTMVFNKKAAEIYISHLPDIIKVHDFLMYQLCMFLGKVIYDENSYIYYRQHGGNQIGKPNFTTRMRKRLQGHYKEHTLELQNYYFLKAYKCLLHTDDIGLLSKIVFYRNNFFSKIALICDNKIRYTRFERNIFYIIKIIMGCV